MKIILEHPNTGIMKKAPIGASGTTLFFGPLPALFRGDLKWAAIMLLVGMCTGGLSNLIFAFTYNKTYITGLVEKGYKVKSTEGETLEKIKAKVGINLQMLDK